MRRLLFVLVLLVAGCGAFSSPRDVECVGEIRVVLERNDESRVEDGLHIVSSEVSGYGNAFAISQTRIVTAAHIFERGGGLVVGEVYVNGQLLEIRGVERFGSDGVYVDVARIPSDMPVLQFTRRRARGDSVHMPTNYGGGRVVRGKILAQNSVDFVAIPGMSGSPVINGSGKVIGVLSQVIPSLGVSTFTGFESLK